MKHDPRPDAAKILFIAYHFPPSAAVGGQRVANFASAIRSFGWEPQVLTIDDADIERIEPARLQAVEGIPIHKVRRRRGLVGILDRLWRLRQSRKPASSSARRDAGVPASPAPTNGARPAGLRRFVLSLLALPDWERGWCAPAAWRACTLIRREGFQWFMTSCPPYSVHLVGLAVKVLTGASWVADFRDPWMTTGSKRLYPTSWLSVRIERLLERQVIEKADIVMFNVERLRDAYRRRYSWVAPGKFVFVPNGITRAERGAAPKYDVFTIAYTGSLYVGRSPEPVFEAVARLVRAGRIPPDRIRVKLVGQCGSIDGVPTTAVARRHGLEDVVEVLPSVPYDQAFEIVRRSHLALLLAPNLPYQIPAKVYDYLGAGTRILAIAEEGGTADLLAATQAGSAFRTDQVGEIAEFIYSEFASPAGPAGASPALLRYDVHHITGELVRHLGGTVTVAAAKSA